MSDSPERTALDTTSKDELYDLARSLVAIPSDPKVGTQGVAEYLESFLAKEELVCHVEAVRPPAHLNLVVEYAGNSGHMMLLLNGHIDTVPPIDPPQAVRLDEQRLYGRGAVDMKGAVAAMSLALVAVNRARLSLKHGVMFSAVAGEEIGGIGTKAFIDTGRRPAMAVIGEPTQLRLVAAHKGIEWIELQFSGKAVHASCPERGANAIVAASRAVIALNDLASRINTSIDRKSVV